jgi:hypothetical protein
MAQVQRFDFAKGELTSIDSSAASELAAADLAILVRGFLQSFVPRFLPRFPYALGRVGIVTEPTTQGLRWDHWECIVGALEAGGCARMSLWVELSEREFAEFLVTTQSN